MKKNKRVSSSGSYRTLGTLSDGVVLLAPKVKATHFTSAEIRETIAKVLRDKATAKLRSGE